MHRKPVQDYSNGQSLYYLVRPAAGGMRSHLQVLLDHFGRRYPVHLAAPPGCGLQDHANRHGGTYMNLSLAAGIDPAGDIIAFRRLLAELKERRPVLLHIHGIRAALPALPAAALAGIPVVLTLHSFPAHPGAAFFPVVARMAARSGAVRFITVSCALAGEAARWGIDPGQVNVIYNGIDPAPFERAARVLSFTSERKGGREEEGSLLVGTVARMAPQKGLPHLLKAAALLAPQFPRMRFLLAGDGPDRPALRQLSRRLGLASRIAFPGYCDDLPRCLAAVDIFVLPSLAEGLSIMLVEAMAAGCAVVASAVGGVPEVITGGVDGLLVAPGDPGALAAAVTALARDPARRRAMGRAAAAKVRRCFTVERMLCQTGEVYERIMERAQADAY